MSTFRIYQWVKLQQRRRLHKGQQQSKNRHRWLVWLLAGASLFLAIPILLLGYNLSLYLTSSPDISLIPALFDSEKGAFAHPTELYDRTGGQIIYQHDQLNSPRVYRSVDVDAANGVSPYLIQTMITLIEPTFWSGSSIPLTQWLTAEPQTMAERLVDRFILKDNLVGLQRALQLRTLGQNLTHTYGKNKVLEWYLNSAYFGQKAYGVESAAQLYFQKSANKLNFAESVLLAAIEQAPALNPLDAPTAYQTLYHETLKVMFERGALNMEEFSAAQQAPPVVQPVEEEARQPYMAFSTQVMQQLINQYGNWKVGFGGLKVQTTLDLDLQHQITCVTELQLNRLKQPVDVSITADLEACPAAYYLPALPAFQEPITVPLSASVLIQDVETGQVLAYLGDTRDGLEQAKETRHQAASLLTPILSTAAISRGFSPSTLVWDIPPTGDSPWATYATSQTKYLGPQRLRYAIANDLFFPLLELYESIGSEAFWNTAAGLGLDNPALRSSQADVLMQGNSASILEISQAYQPIANLGIQHGVQSPDAETLNPVFAMQVEQTDGIVLPPLATQERAVLSPGLAYVVHHMLQDETARWPSLGYPNLTEISRPSGVKIGRTLTHDESWTLGYTRQRLITVWLGQPASDAPQAISWQPSTGIWNALMKFSGKNLPAESWQAPVDVSALEVCDPSGKLPTVDCPNTVNEIFISGNEPISYDDLYRSVQINRETGYLATAYTPLELVVEKTYLILPEFAKGWAKSQQIEQPPEMYDTLVTSHGTATAQINSPTAYAVVHDTVEIKGTASGENFKSYRLQIGEGLNPRTWLQISEEQIQPVEDGLLVTWKTEKDGLYAIRLSVIQQDQSLETHLVQVTVDNTIPTAEILYPRDASQLKTDGENSTYFQVLAEDSIGIAKAAWYLDGQWIADSTEEPYGVLWLPTPGQHTLVVKVTDLAGNLGISNVVNFEVRK